MTSLSGGRPVHYRCDEENGWNPPDIADIASKITDRTKRSSSSTQQPDGRGLLTRNPAAARRTGA